MVSIYPIVSDSQITEFTNLLLPFIPSNIWGEGGARVCIFDTRTPGSYYTSNVINQLIML